MSIVRVQDLREQVYVDLRERILNGEFPADTKFQEIALSETLGVSRTPVREALAMLVRDGLLVQARRGFRFPQRSPRDVIDIIEVRMRLEPYAIRKVVERMTPEARMDLAARMRKHITAAPDSDGYIQSHAAMRKEILKHVGNQVFVDAIQQFEEFVHLMRSSTLSEPRWRERSVKGNLALCDAIEAGDADRAEQIQVQLLEMARDSFLTHLAMSEGGAAS